MMTVPFTCPRCFAVSWNKHDAENGYCGACHWWTGDPVLAIVPVPGAPPESEEERVTEILREKGWSADQIQAWFAGI